MTYEELVSKLKREEVEVTFTKVDGSERVMRATLMESKLPKIDYVEKSSTKPKNTSVISVWDLDNEGWRSFRVANVIKVN